MKKQNLKSRKTLTEAEAKEVLKKYGIPVVEEKAVKTIEETEIAAKEIGYPVVLKGLGLVLRIKQKKVWLSST